MKKNIIFNKIESHIFFIRGQRVMIDADLAELYGGYTKRLNEQIKRNINKEYFIFEKNYKQASATHLKKNEK